MLTTSFEESVVEIDRYIDNFTIPIGAEEAAAAQAIAARMRRILIITIAEHWAAQRPALDEMRRTTTGTVVQFPRR
ncbi:hypothetical protein ELH42_16885 [Rhizobium ruizarguesonis]|uniref:hypothetical protein n=1 Tax=Rhizobium ruizarguesonis TaxID=2081791 RepID=UPI001030936D|nr:hypothetical protein [Rhizobium ruizarguesonis]TBB67731.1 hypothetical protein ELH42_16885 [Rhizobium ruizarguesonis]